MHLSRNQAPVRAWLCTPEAAGQPWPLAILCHGLPAAQATTTEHGYLALADQIVAAGFAALVFNFEGCGLSGGRLDLNAWRQDLNLIISAAAACNQIDPRQIHLIGFSAGGAVAAAVLQHSPAAIKSLLLVASPANLAEILPSEPEKLWRHFAAIGCVPPDLPSDLKDWYAGFAFDTTAALAGRSCPLGLIHGTADETVPAAHAERLFAAAAEPRQLKMLAGGSHRLRLDERATKLILEWLVNEWKD